MTNDNNSNEINNGNCKNETKSEINEITNKSKSDKSSIKSANKQGFDVNLICEAFEKFNSNGQLSLDYYLNGYKELVKFFENLGRIFSFVVSDVDSKLKILENYYLDKDNGKYYTDLKTMIEYERESNILQNGKNGTRTLLRLHRALQFISEFLKELTKLDEHENTNSICAQAYERTLMRYHTWLISKGAKLAMYTLPCRSELVNRVFGHQQEHNREQINESMLKIAQLTEQAFNKTQTLYEENNLLDLP